MATTSGHMMLLTTSQLFFGGIYIEVIYGNLSRIP